MLLRLRIFLLALCAALALPALADAAGGNYVFEGGTPAEQAQVRDALDASSFDWSLVPDQITVRIARGIDSEATLGTVQLDANLLDSGRFSWGVVQHEYAHQVDFFLLNDAKRTQLARALGGSSWWAAGSATSLAPNGTLKHAQLSSERFASTLAWAFWPSPDNCMKPQLTGGESGTMRPAAFRALLKRVLTS